MSPKHKSNTLRSTLILAAVFLLIVEGTLGYILLRQSAAAMISLMKTRMLDISNTAASMLDGDVLRELTPADEGTPGYEAVLRTLTHFQDNIELKYIYCIRDMGDGTFTFGLDPTVEDPGEFGSPIVYTDALYRASLGTPMADEEPYEDAWGRFYSAYSPVFDSSGRVAGIVAVDFSAEWYDHQIVTLVWKTVMVSLLSLLIGGALVFIVTVRSRKRLRLLHRQMNELGENVSTLIREVGSTPFNSAGKEAPPEDERADIDSLGEKILAMQRVLRTQIAQVQEQAYRDGLTGVRNKASYLDTVRHIEELIAEGRADFTVAVFDLNGLKTMNDRFGHTCGDRALSDTAKALEAVYGAENVYRVGGDEFVTLTAASDEETVKDGFRRVEAALAEADRAAGAGLPPLSVSKGYASFRPGEEYAEVFKRADHMMYDDKAAYYRTHEDRRSPRRTGE